MMLILMIAIHLILKIMRVIRTRPLEYDARQRNHKKRIGKSARGKGRVGVGGSGTGSGGGGGGGGGGSGSGNGDGG